MIWLHLAWFFFAIITKIIRSLKSICLATKSFVCVGPYYERRFSVGIVGVAKFKRDCI